MYLVGATHPYKEISRQLLEDAIRRERRLVSDAEVLQEILHRYTAISRRDAIEPAFQALLAVVDTVHAIERQDVERASRILRDHPGLSARDALHVAVMERHEIREILSFDAGFDAVEGIRRIALPE